MANVSHTIKTVTALAMGLQMVQPAMAHNGVLHGQTQDEVSEDPQPSIAEPEPVDASVSAAESNSEVITVESATDANISQPASTTFSLENFPIGFGEILFGLILIFPWLLITLRKQLHLSTRS